jgi:ubiquinone/menaquinone biosynthesis C-methylase UbiE
LIWEYGKAEGMHAEETSVRNFKVQDASSYDTVTDDFDRFSARFSAPVAGRLISLAELRGSEQILDVGTGTGIVAFHAANTLTARGKVTAIDLSDGMLNAARMKAHREAFTDRMEFLRMDAEKLELPARSIDVALSLYALRHFPRPDVALAEIFRVLRPGGRVIVAVGSGPPRCSIEGIKAAFGRLRDLVQDARKRQLIACEFLDDLVRRSVQTSPGFQDSLPTDQHLHTTDPVPKLFRAAGFNRVRQEWIGHRWTIDEPEEFWRLQSTFSSFARKRLALISPTELQTLRDQFLDTCRKVKARGGRLIYQTGTLFVRGHVSWLEAG